LDAGELQTAPDGGVASVDSHVGAAKSSASAHRRHLDTRAFAIGHRADHGEAVAGATLVEAAIAILIQFHERADAAAEDLDIEQAATE
jgi:hypothetical protein